MTQSETVTTTSRPRQLSPQQIRVLAGIAQGKSRKQIAQDLGISIHTVRSYLYSAYDRLGARNGFEAVAKMTAQFDQEA